MPGTHRIVVLAGDGIGPEVMAPTLRILDQLGSFEFEQRLIGGAAIDAEGEPISDDTVAACHRSDGVLLGAAGGPKWDTTEPGAPRPENGLQRQRRDLQLFANLRPIRTLPTLAAVSPIRPERLVGTDFLIVRELTGGLYFGARGRDGERAFDTCEYTVPEIERVARRAFQAARGKLTSIDKSNVLETSRMWREVVERIHALEFPEIELEHLLVDNAAVQLMVRPASFDVIVTENLFGDILSDAAGVLVGSLGLLPSASLGANGGPGLFEPVHGSAPDIAGREQANPLGMFLSAALMLRLGLELHDEARSLEQAVLSTLQSGLRTRDLGGSATTSEVTASVLSNLLTCKRPLV
jgi:3-isopropylmalate dehydrogenase